MSIAYRYAEGDLLEVPNSYAYAPYEGAAFIQAWWRSRQAALEALPAPVQSAGAHDDGRGATGARLAGLRRRLVAGETGARTDLDRLLRHYEASRRIYADYTDEWRPKDKGDYRDLGLYLGFAEVLELAYTKIGTLTYLNALLKCLDTLTAMCAALPVSEGARLARLILRERACVVALDARVRGRR